MNLTSVSVEAITSVVVAESLSTREGSVLWCQLISVKSRQVSWTHIPLYWVIISFYNFFSPLHMSDWESLQSFNIHKKHTALGNSDLILFKEHVLGIYQLISILILLAKNVFKVLYSNSHHLPCHILLNLVQSENSISTVILAWEKSRKHRESYLDCRERDRPE